MIVWINITASVFQSVPNFLYLLVDVAQEVDFISQSSNLILQICLHQVG